MGKNLGWIILGAGFWLVFFFPVLSLSPVEFLPIELLMGIDGLSQAARGDSWFFWEFLWWLGEGERGRDTGRFGLGAVPSALLLPWHWRGHRLGREFATTVRPRPCCLLLPPS